MDNMEESNNLTAPILLDTELTMTTQTRVEDNDAFDMQQPFVTQEHKFNYWTESKSEIKRLQSAKQDGEREIAELKEQLSDRLQDLNFEFNRANENDADNNRLRDALDSIASDIDTWHSDVAIKALAATPSQSLQEHDNEVIEKCANVASLAFDSNEIVDAILALKELNQSAP